MPEGAPAQYARPPIVEAVVELRFARRVGRDHLVDSLKATLGGHYPGRMRMDAVGVTAEIDTDGSGVAPSARRSEHIRFMISADGLRLLSCGTARFGVHVLTPYPGWDNFRTALLEATGALPPDVRSTQLTTVVVRYIDRIIPPGVVQDWSTYCRVLPRVPLALPGTSNHVRVDFHSLDPAAQVQTTLTIAADAATLTYDLTLLRPLNSTCTVSGIEWLEAVEHLHLLQRQVFEQSITDAARALFQ